MPSWIWVGALERVSACASVLATTNSTPWRLASIMLLTAFPPAPPTPITTIRGVNSTAMANLDPHVPTLPAHGAPDDGNSMKIDGFWLSRLKSS